MILSGFFDEYSSSFEEQLNGLKRFSIDYTELRLVNGKNISELSFDECKELKKALDQNGIRVSAIGSPLGKIRLDGDISAHIETAKRIFQMAQLFETEFVRVFSFYAPYEKNITDMKDQAFSCVEKLLCAARPYNVTLCHENEANIYGATPERCLELLDYFGGELKCVFDMGNFVLEGVDPYPEAYKLLQKYIAYFHIKDALFAGAIVPAGKGQAKIKDILLAHAEYSDGNFFVSLEPHLQTFDGLNALVGRSFENPYKYENQQSAFCDAIIKFKELMKP